MSRFSGPQPYIGYIGGGYWAESVGYIGGTTGGILRNSGAESVGFILIGDRRSCMRRKRRTRVDVTLNSNNPTLKGGEQLDTGNARDPLCYAHVTHEAPTCTGKPYMLLIFAMIMRL